MPAAHFLHWTSKIRKRKRNQSSHIQHAYMCTFKWTGKKISAAQCGVRFWIRFASARRLPIDCEYFIGKCRLMMTTTTTTMSILHLYVWYQRTISQSGILISSVRVYAVYRTFRCLAFTYCVFSALLNHILAIRCIHWITHSCKLHKPFEIRFDSNRFRIICEWRKAFSLIHSDHLSHAQCAPKYTQFSWKQRYTTHTCECAALFNPFYYGMASDFHCITWVCFNALPSSAFEIANI